MADSIININEVRLNSVRYPIIDKVVMSMVSSLATKQVTGDYDKTSDPNKSNWSILGDARGGLLVDEMDESVDAKRFLWSNCETRLKGHLTLGDLATSITLSSLTTLAVVNGDMELTTGWTGGARSASHPVGGTYSWLVANSTAYQDLAGWETAYQGLTIKVSCSAWADAGSSVRIYVSDGVDTTYSSYHTGSSSNESLTVTHHINAAATSIRLGMASGVTADGFFDNYTITEQPVAGTPAAMENFNNNLYLAYGRILAKLNGTGTGFSGVYSFPATITDIKAGVNSCLYIAQGDSAFYYMTAAEVVAATDKATADLFADWDSKLFWLDQTDNKIYYSVTPNVASPTATANGTLSGIPLGATKRLEVDVDNTGVTIIYAGTTKGAWAHDYAGAVWVHPKLQVPEHANGGMGFASWHSALYLSAGLNVKQYVADSNPATIANVGLDQRDGIPAEYAGEIVYFVKGFDELYALVDASQVTGTGYSCVYALNDSGAWRCIWEDTNTDAALNVGIVSSTFAYRLWFTAGTTVYYIPLQRSLQNPLKVSSKTYRASGLHITSWFDGNWLLGNKVAYRIRIAVGGDISANETVTVKYRINHSNTDRDTGWTTLGSAITAAGESTIDFGSSLGITFRSIQFRFELARAAGSTTETPDVFYATLEYEPLLPIKWGWQFTVDCNKPYNDKSPEQLLDALDTAAASETLLTFMYEDVSKNVKVKSVQCTRLTGEGRKGEYLVLVQEA